jgi:hypothetical protein
MTWRKQVDDAQIRAMVSYIVEYLNKNCPEQLETMIHLIGHDESYRKRVSEITEAIIDYHDKLFMECSSGKKIEDLAPEYAEQCGTIRKKMRNLVDEYLSEYSKPN